MISVLISVPCEPPWLHKLSVFALLRLIQDPRYKVRVIMPSHRPFENNLHHIVHEWITDSREDYWLTFDADNPPINNPLDLIALDKDIIGCPTPIWHNSKPGDRPYYWNVYDYVEEEDAYREHQPQTGLQKVAAVGTGCVVYARRVFENTEMQKAPFQRTYDNWGRVGKGNDIAFCERARKQGFEVWAHFGYPCRHFSEVDLVEVIEAFGAVHTTCAADGASVS